GRRGQGRGGRRHPQPAPRRAHRGHRAPRRPGAGPAPLGRGLGPHQGARPLRAPAARPPAPPLPAARPVRGAEPAPSRPHPSAAPLTTSLEVVTLFTTESPTVDSSSIIQMAGVLSGLTDP